MLMYVLVLLPLLFPERGVRMWVLSAACKTHWAEIQIVCPSYHLTSWGNSALIYTRSASTKCLLSAWKSWKDNYLGINGLIQPITYEA